ncbi:MAG: BRO-N domain protein [Dasosvirus sp.]|uniref:BRO-N domain protein n=1 Tax=Dasosvirus sp. TaxID=2487764 RepID=A0A3G4ZRG5_9VIRU|nr:MAG: BRO-N domain protein [Dasosvirus sp.]
MYQKRIVILENNQSKPKYPQGGYVYAVQPPNINDLDSNLHKIGKSKKISARLNNYDTAYPDRVILVHKIKVDDPTAVEYCIKALLNKYIYRTRKEFFKVSRTKLIETMERCALMIDENNKEENIPQLSRARSSKNKSEEDEEIFGIFSVTKEEEERNKDLPDKESMNGGGTSESKRGKYIFNKMMYIKLISKNSFPKRFI